MEKKFEIVPYNKEEIKDENDLSSAKSFLLQVKEVRNKIEAERKELTKPILDSKKKLDEKYKTIDAPFLKMETSVKKMMTEYLNLKELEIKKEVGKDVAKLAIKDEKVSFRIEYDIEIVDITKVSKDYLLLDEPKIKQKIKEGQKSFSGLRLVERKVIIAR